MALDQNKKKTILSNIVSKAKDFINPVGASGMKWAEFATQVMRQDELRKKLGAPITMPRKNYNDKMISNEADKIFMKNRPDLALKDETFPLTWSMNASPNYNREYKRTLDQVAKTRKAMNK